MYTSFIWLFSNSRPSKSDTVYTIDLPFELFIMKYSWSSPGIMLESSPDHDFGLDEPSKGRQQVSGVAGVFTKMCTYISCTYVYIHLWLYLLIHIYQSLIVHAYIYIYTHINPTLWIFEPSIPYLCSFGFSNARSGDIWTSKSLVRSILGANRSSAPVNTTTGGRATGDVRGSNKVMFGCIFSIKGGWDLLWK